MSNEFTNGQLTKIVKGQADIITKMQETINHQQARIDLLDGNVHRLMAEIANAKNVMAHVSGRGMGPTVQEG